MRKLIVFVTALALATASVAGNDEGKKGKKKKSPDKYCAHLKDGVIKVTHDGQDLTADITLENGTQIRTDGTIVKKDGTVTVLKEGQCVDVNGQTDDLLPPVKKQ